MRHLARDSSPDMSTPDEREGPWGERTPRQRIATYATLLAFAAVCTALWWTGIVEGSVGPARAGDVIFPAVAVFFAVRLTREIRARRVSG